MPPPNDRRARIFPEGRRRAPHPWRYLRRATASRRTEPPPWDSLFPRLPATRPCLPSYRHHRYATSGPVRNPWTPSLPFWLWPHTLALIQRSQAQTRGPPKDAGENGNEERGKGSEKEGA